MELYPSAYRAYRPTEHLTPTLNDLARLYNFTIESQVQFHAPLAFEPVPLGTAVDSEAGMNATEAAQEPPEANEAGLTPEQLTVFVNSAEWSLCKLVSLYHPHFYSLIVIPFSIQRLQRPRPALLTLRA